MKIDWQASDWQERYISEHKRLGKLLKRKLKYKNDLEARSPAKSVTCFDRLEYATVEEAIGTLLRTLSFREREIIKLRYGIGVDCTTHTLEEVGRIFKITRDRVRQIQNKAIKKLQHPTRVRLLEQFADVARRGGK